MPRTLLGTVLSLVIAQLGSASDEVTLLRTPKGGIQPQAIADATGALHLIYFKGEAAAGDLFYVHREAAKEQFSEPIRVNSETGSAIAVGTVRGGQLALGKAGRVHVVWNGSRKGMFYSRLNDAGTAFEQQQDLVGDTSLLDGGGTIAADDAGNVYVAWHAIKGSVRGAENRRVWVARSTDEGISFSREARAWARATGACPCCSTRAFADSKGSVYMLYRSANAEVNRDIYLLSSRDSGKSFQGSVVHRWRVPD